MQILAIDPGLSHMGYAVLQKSKKKHHIVEYGLISTKSTDPLPKRLDIIQKDITKILKKYPLLSSVAIEKLFFVKNVTNGLLVSKVIGVLLLTLYKHQIDYTEYSPMEVKIAITGYGMSDKLAMRQMLQQMYPDIKLKKQDDSLDAIAIGITHLLSLK